MFSSYDNWKMHGNSHYCEECNATFTDSEGGCNCHQCDCGANYPNSEAEGEDTMTSNHLLDKTHCNECGHWCSECETHWPEGFYHEESDTCIFCHMKAQILDTAKFKGIEEKNLIIEITGKHPDGDKSEIF